MIILAPHPLLGGEVRSRQQPTQRMTEHAPLVDASRFAAESTPGTRYSFCRLVAGLDTRLGPRAVVSRSLTRQSSCRYVGNDFAFVEDSQPLISPSLCRSSPHPGPNERKSHEPAARGPLSATISIRSWDSDSIIS
jgi:hypothetical protein